MNYIFLSTHLSSVCVPIIEKHLGKRAKDIKIAYLTTAANTYKDEKGEYPEWVHKHYNLAKDHCEGMSLALVDIDDMAGDELVWRTSFN